MNWVDQDHTFGSRPWALINPGLLGLEAWAKVASWIADLTSRAAVGAGWSLGMPSSFLSSQRV